MASGVSLTGGHPVVKNLLWWQPFVMRVRNACFYILATYALLALLAGTWLTSAGGPLMAGAIDNLLLVIYPAVVGLALLFSLFVISSLIRFYERRIRRLNERDSALKQNEAMLRSITEMVSVGIIRADRDGNCIFVNPRYCAISGQDFIEALGDGWWRSVLPDDVAQVRRGWQILLEQGTAFSVEYRLVRPGAEVAWVYAQAQRQIGLHGEITGLVCSVTDITASKLAENEIQHLAFYDSLTGLPNRRLLMDRLKQAVSASSRTGASCSLFFLDLDNFKTLNDTMGHDVGDLLLQQVALRLKGSIREGDTVARLGGDEFVVVLENLSHDKNGAARQAELVGEKILHNLNQPYDLLGYQNYNSLSIGIAMFNNADDSVDELMKCADMAMYQAKAAGRNTLCFYDPEMQAVIAARVDLERELRLGLKQNQFLLNYQPQVDVQGKITGVEAFVRWLHPQRGMVSPASFISLAEETGLIVPLDNWVLDTACQQLSRWSANPDTCDLTMSVKVSGQQFRQFDFVNQVLATLERTQARAEVLKLELNESLLMVDVEDIIDKTVILKERGVGCSLADLGTGYSSLSHLKRLSLDQLRIDQSFVRGLLTNSNDAAVTKSIFALAESLDLKVSAEGVETQEQRDALAAHGCQAYQGYFFSQPLSAQAFEQLLGRQ